MNIKNISNAGTLRRALALLIDVIILYISGKLISEYRQFPLFLSIVAFILNGIIMTAPILMMLKDDFSKKIHNIKNNNFLKKFITYFIFIISLALCIILSPLGLIFYFAIYESSKFEGTLGKIIMKIKLVTLQGKRISFLRSFFRLASLLCMLSIYGYFCTANPLPFLAIFLQLDTYTDNQIVALQFLSRVALVVLYICLITKNFQDMFFKSIVIKR